MSPKQARNKDEEGNVDLSSHALGLTCLPVTAKQPFFIPLPTLAASKVQLKKEQRYQPEKSDMFKQEVSLSDRFGLIERLFLNPDIVKVAFNFQLIMKALMRFGVNGTILLRSNSFGGDFNTN
jgi:hypothetical protein